MTRTKVIYFLVSICVLTGHDYVYHVKKICYESELLYGYYGDVALVNSILTYVFFVRV